MLTVTAIRLLILPEDRYGFAARLLHLLLPRPARCGSHRAASLARLASLPPAARRCNQPPGDGRERASDSRVTSLAPRAESSSAEQCSAEQGPPCMPSTDISVSQAPESPASSHPPPLNRVSPPSSVQQPEYGAKTVPVSGLFRPEAEKTELRRADRQTDGQKHCRNLSNLAAWRHLWPAALSPIFRIGPEVGPSTNHARPHSLTHPVGIQRSPSHHHTHTNVLLCM